MKKIIIVIVVVLVLGAAWYLISPVFRNVELDEQSPLATTLSERSDDDIRNNMDEMSPEEKAEFKQAIEESSTDENQMSEEMPDDSPTVIAEAEFMASAHSVSGKALLIEVGDKKVLRFEDFETINGPNLHIYLASDFGGKDFIDLGPIKATKGNVNYDVDASIDTSKYNKVLVWCVPFKVLFSYAEL